MQQPVADLSNTPGTSMRETVHDLRNLFAIVTSAKHMLEDQPAKVRRLALLQAIEAAAKRGTELTTHLLSERRSIRGGAFDLNEEIMSLEPMIRALAPRIGFDLCDAYLPLRQVGDTVDSVIFELLANAKAAGATSIVVRTRLSGRQAWLTIADNGTGMDEGTLARIRRFEDLHRGHGSGLHRVNAFVRAAHGHIAFRSQSGKGTVAALVLPLVLGLVLDRRPPLTPLRATASAAAAKLALCPA